MQMPQIETEWISYEEVSLDGPKMRRSQGAMEMRTRDDWRDRRQVPVQLDRAVPISEPRGPAGRNTRKVAPCPGVLSTSIQPP